MRKYMVTRPDGLCTFKECEHCKYEKEYCSNPEYGIEACPVFSAAMHKLAAYEDLANIDVLRRNRNEEVLMSLNIEALSSPHYLYECHLGGYCLSADKRTAEELYCEECGDSDTYLGEVQSFMDAWNLVNGDSDPEYYFGPIFELFYPEKELLGEFIYPWYEPDDEDEDEWIDTVDYKMINKFLDRFKK